MTIDPRPGMVRFKGIPTVFFMAVCRDCDMALPFNTEARRAGWADEHQTTGHIIEFAVDIRPDPRTPFAFVTRETWQQQWNPPHQWQVQKWLNRDPLLAQETDNQVMSMESTPPPQDDLPKKLNARDRRRLRRKDKQRNDT